MCCNKGLLQALHTCLLTVVPLSDQTTGTYTTLPQGIYEFRGASPKHLSDSFKQWAGPQATTMWLKDNYRSRKAIVSSAMHMLHGRWVVQPSRIAPCQPGSSLLSLPSPRVAYLSLPYHFVMLMTSVCKKTINQCPCRPAKDVQAKRMDKAGQASVEVVLAPNQQQEVQVICRALWQQHQAGRRWQDMTVLLRSNRQVSSVGRAVPGCLPESHV
jgi:superfamily I DNA/RNA helicase